MMTPRDGTKILAATLKRNGCASASWNSTYEKAWVLDFAGGHADDDVMRPQPTHWMPLPEPPNV